MTVQDFGSFEDVSTVPDSSGGAPQNGEVDAPPPLVYGSAEEFLHDQLLPTYIRNVRGKQMRWCNRWFLHPEAITRITALWRAWEKLRLEAGTGSSDWWLQHADPHMRVLLDPEGPFFNCGDGHSTPKTLEAEMAPTGWFPDERDDPAT